jgi:hypothetical protein
MYVCVSIFKMIHGLAVCPWLMPIILVTQETDQEDCGLKLPWANSLWDPISKKKSQKMAGGVTQGVGPEFKPQYCNTAITEGFASV